MPGGRDLPYLDKLGSVECSDFIIVYTENVFGNFVPNNTSFIFLYRMYNITQHSLT